LELSITGCVALPRASEKPQDRHEAHAAPMFGLISPVHLQRPPLVINPFESDPTARFLGLQLDNPFSALKASPLDVEGLVRGRGAAPDPFVMHAKRPAATTGMNGPRRELRVWLDDDRARRPAPRGWIHVTKASEAIALLGSGRVVELSLDHDLGDEAKRGSGADVLDYLARQQELCGRDLWPRDGITLHAADARARDAMARTIREYAGKVSRIEQRRTADGRARFAFRRRPRR